MVYSSNVLLSISEKWRGMIKPDFMEASAFVAILEHGGFTKAAGRLGISVPRVSELLRNFEERLGVRLVDRTTRSVSPTLAGEALLVRLGPLLDEFRAALETTSEFKGTISGLLRLAVDPLAAESLLEGDISPFLKRYPEVDLEISVDGGLVNVVEDRFDAAIRFGNFVDRDMITTRISENIPIVVVASPSYIEKYGEPSHPRDLSGHSCFSLRLQSGATIPWRFQDKGRVLKMQVSGRLIASTTVMQVRAAVEGLGLFQGTRTTVADEIAAGKLVTVLDDWAPPPLEGICLYYPSRRQMRPALRALVNFIREQKS